jgi:hypothetical protein
MKKLLLTADYKTTGLKEFDGGWLNSKKFDLPNELWKEIENWVESYQFVIPLDAQNRDQIKDKIISLDNKGLQIASKIRYLKKDYIVLYYSEGLLSYM